MNLVISLCNHTRQIIFYPTNSSNFYLGFMVGLAFMNSEIHFMMAVTYYSLGAEATHNKYGELNIVSNSIIIVDFENNLLIPRMCKC
jgi:hypothetical protein